MIYWSVYSSSRRERDGVEGESRYFSQLQGLLYYVVGSKYKTSFEPKSMHNQGSKGVR